VRPRTQRRNLTRIQKRHSKESHREKQRIHEDERASSTDSFQIFCAWRRGACDDGHAGSHAECGDDHEFASAETLDGENTNGRADGLPGEDASGDNTGGFGGEAEVGVEDVGLVEACVWILAYRRCELL